MAQDAIYREEVMEIMEEFAGSDSESFQIGEGLLVADSE
jgi:hypothetical protein